MYFRKEEESLGREVGELPAHTPPFLFFVSFFSSQHRWMRSYGRYTEWWQSVPWVHPPLCLVLRCSVARPLTALKGLQNATLAERWGAGPTCLHSPDSYFLYSSWWSHHPVPPPAQEAYASAHQEILFGPLLPPHHPHQSLTHFRSLTNPYGVNYLITSSQGPWSRK